MLLQDNLLLKKEKENHFSPQLPWLLRGKHGSECEGNQCELSSG
jgi:hypothetical protein